MPELSPEQLARGVVTHSSGNHAAAVALAAQMKGAEAHIVVPRTAPKVKLTAVREYGGQVHLCEPTMDARDATESFPAGTRSATRCSTPAQA